MTNVDLTPPSPLPPPPAAPSPSPIGPIHTPPTSPAAPSRCLSPRRLIVKPRIVPRVKVHHWLILTWPTVDCTVYLSAHKGESAVYYWSVLLNRDCLSREDTSCDKGHRTERGVCSIRHPRDNFRLVSDDCTQPQPLARASYLYLVGPAAGGACDVTGCGARCEPQARSRYVCTKGQLSN